MPLPRKTDHIFVSIASYRDDVCSTTLTSLYKMAQHPNRITVGICQQNKRDDTDCVENSLTNDISSYKKNVRIIRIPEYEAKGPTWARYLCSTLWGGEEYYLQIDSHTKFVKNWDTKCINMVNIIKKMGLSKKPVISHYPKDYDSFNSHTEENKYDVPRMCKSFFNERGMLSFMGAEILPTSNIPYNVPYLASGMFFCESYFLDELPYDPNLPYLFVGEEILHSIRFYTFGWDIFTPTENVVFHEYTRATKPKVWTDNQYSDEQAFNKVKKYLNLIDDSVGIREDISVNMDKYGLGKDRSLQDYYNFAGIDMENKKVTTNFCRENNKASDADIKDSNQAKKIESFELPDTNKSFSLSSILFPIGLSIIVFGWANYKRN